MQAKTETKGKKIDHLGCPIYGNENETKSLASYAFENC